MWSEKQCPENKKLDFLFRGMLLQEIRAQPDPFCPLLFSRESIVQTSTGSVQTSLLTELLANSHQGCKTAWGGGRTSVKLNFHCLKTLGQSMEMKETSAKKGLYKHRFYEIKARKNSPEARGGWTLLGGQWKPLQPPTATCWLKGDWRSPCSLSQLRAGRMRNPQAVC